MFNLSALFKQDFGMITYGYIDLIDRYRAGVVSLKGRWHPPTKD